MRSYRIDEAVAHGWVRTARHLGYALRDRGLVPGTRALSVAIRDEAGRPFAAVTVAGVTRRMGHLQVEALASQLQDIAATIGRELRR